MHVYSLKTTIQGSSIVEALKGKKLFELGEQAVVDHVVVLHGNEYMYIDENVPVAYAMSVADDKPGKFKAKCYYEWKPTGLITSL